MFTMTEKKYLHDVVYRNAEEQFKEDYPQMERAAEVAKYYWYEGEKKHLISRTTAKRMMGMEMWLSGIARAAFHWDACRQSKDGKRDIFVDCRAMFK